VGALICGLLLVKLRRFIIAVVTAVVGSFLFSQGLPPDYQALGLPISLIVFLAVQVGLVSRYVDEESFDRRTRRRLRDDAIPDVHPVD
jgi:hypothetical protein